MNVCTIVSRRELARARVLAATLHEHQPDATLAVLLLDADPQDVGEIAHADLLGLGEVAEDAGRLAAGNPPGALPAALLPRLVETILDRGAGSVVYLGVGQRVLGPLDELSSLLVERHVVLVARASAAQSTAGSESFEGDRNHGAYSRGLLGFRDGPATRALLAAWPSYFASADGDDGQAAVSSWLQSLPAIVDDLGVLRDLGYGLDPWTLASRTLDGGTGVLEVGGRPAREVDLGELDASDPVPSFVEPGQVLLSSHVELSEIVSRHRDELLAAGYGEDRAYPPPFAELADGARLTPTIRGSIVELIEEGGLASSPFTEAGRVELYEWLNRPADRGASAGLTRLHMAIWAARGDLQLGYPHIDGPDGAGFAGWLCLNGREQEGLVDELLPPTPELAYRDANPHAHEDAPRWGTNVVGFFTAELGVGEAARLLIGGLDAASIPALPIQGHLAPPSRQEAEFEYARIDEAAYPINILCINGDGIPVFAREAGRSFFENRYTIALWWWEVGAPPPTWSQSYEFIDEVWVASQHIYDAIAPTSPVPVVRVKLPVSAPTVAPRGRAELGLPEDGFLFLYVHDYHSVAARKNPLGLIEAFKRAFPPGAGTRLVLKSINAETRPAEHERVLVAASEHADITVLDAYVSGAEKNAMIAACDCYVSLHRSEGFGLTVAEAMLLGKPVIATRYGGTLEFMNEENSYLVQWAPVAVGEGAYPYAPGGVWAEPDVDHAVALMQHVFAQPEEGRARGQIARREMLEHHSPAVAGATMERRLSLLHRRLQDAGLRSMNLTHLPSLQDAGAAPAITGPPSIDWGGGWLRRIKRRAYRPVAAWAQAYTKHEVAIDLETDRAIARIDARLREVATTLQDQQKAQHAETLAVLRRLQAEQDRSSESAGPANPDGVRRALRPEAGSPDSDSASRAQGPVRPPQG